MYSPYVTFVTFMLWLLLLALFPPSSLSLDCQPLVKTIVVDQSGGGDSNTVQAAIDSVPANNDEWIKIHVKAGTYFEKVIIKEHQECIILEGEGRETTTISWNDHTDTDYSATFSVRADNFLAKGISFVNSHNLEGNLRRNWYETAVGKVTQAVAALIHGDKNSFYQCGFRGYQDTVSDEAGRHYFNECYIEGAIDFIYGYGQSFYENALINVTGYGFITAQGRESPNDSGGFVFENCNIVGNGPTYLGRAYRQFSRVIYHSCTIDANVVPQGWDAWRQDGHENDFKYVESECRGVNYDTTKRPSWVQISDNVDLLEDFTRDNFINQDGWIQRLPV